MKNHKPMKPQTTISRIILPAIFLLFAVVVSGQVKVDTIASLKDTSIYIKVKFNEGSSYYGKLIDNKNDTLTMTTEDLGVIRIPYRKISKIEKFEYMQMKNGKLWFPTPLPGRYLFAPSAFTLKAGEGYYQNTWIFLNSFNVGVTDWFSLGGGIEFLTTIGSITNGEFQPTFFITPKVGGKVAKNLRIGGGILYAQVLGDELKLANFYGVVTYGNEDYNVSAGLGWGYSKTPDVEGGFSKKPLITICGTARVSRKLAFVTENWIIPTGESAPSYYPLYSYGIRFLGESTSIDLAFINNRDIVHVLFIGIPFVSFTVKF